MENSCRSSGSTNASTTESSSMDTERTGSCSSCNQVKVLYPFECSSDCFCNTCWWKQTNSKNLLAAKGSSVYFPLTKPCLHCNEQITESKHLEHEKNCPKRAVDCPHKALGCNEQVQICDLESHSRKCKVLAKPINEKLRSANLMTQEQIKFGKKMASIAANPTVTKEVKNIIFPLVRNQSGHKMDYTYQVDIFSAKLTLLFKLNGESSDVNKLKLLFAVTYRQCCSVANMDLNIVFMDHGLSNYEFGNKIVPIALRPHKRNAIEYKEVPLENTELQKLLSSQSFKAK